MELAKHAGVLKMLVMQKVNVIYMMEFAIQSTATLLTALQNVNWDQFNHMSVNHLNFVLHKIGIANKILAT